MAAPRPQPSPTAASPELLEPSGARRPPGPPRRGQLQGRPVASLLAEELQQLLADVLRAELSGAAGTTSEALPERRAQEVLAGQAAQTSVQTLAARTSAQGDGGAAGAEQSARPRPSVGFLDQHELIRVKPPEAWIRSRSQSNHGRVSVWERVRQMRGAE
ncbi:unnamed protein product [Prorocentrum cordatum]|uniref:Uncharacterized protein n=1 Tax=Prorocentrum cordatum TaxID=2364126 RepID=A0ABN9PFX1_9DINO|nr:unnamed protein product [Polarella glacialis]